MVLCALLAIALFGAALLFAGYLHERSTPKIATHARSIGLFGAALLFAGYVHERSAQPEGAAMAGRPGEEDENQPETLLLAKKLDGDEPKPPPCHTGPATPEELKARAHAYIFREQTRTKVQRWLAKLCVALPEREDVTQTVFKEAVKSWRSYDPKRAGPEQWLRGITFNQAAHYHDLARHRREDLGFEWPTDGTEPADPDPSALERLSAEERRLLVLEAIVAIPDEGLRSVLVAHDLDDIPMAAIAEALGIPESTAYKWRLRALVSLEEQLRRLCAERGEEVAELVPYSRAARGV